MIDASPFQSFFPKIIRTSDDCTTIWQAEQVATCCETSSMCLLNKWTLIIQDSGTMTAVVSACCTSLLLCCRCSLLLCCCWTSLLPCRFALLQKVALKALALADIKIFGRMYIKLCSYMWLDLRKPSSMDSTARHTFLHYMIAVHINYHLCQVSVLVVA